MKKRTTALIGLIALAMMLPTGSTNAYEVDKELSARTSVSPYMVVESADDWTVYVVGRIRRSPVSGTFSELCIGTRGRYFREDVVPRRMIIGWEENCHHIPERVDVDPIAFTASLVGSLPSEVRRYAWEWSDRERVWDYAGQQASSAGIATFDLRFTGTGAVVSPVVHGFPVCIAYSLFMPVTPCPGDMGGGIARSANWEGSVRFSGVGRAFSSVMQGSRVSTERDWPSPGALRPRLSL